MCVVAHSINCGWLQLIISQANQIVDVYQPISLLMFIFCLSFIDSLQNSFLNIDSERNNLILLGDFNMDQLGKNNSTKRLLNSFAIQNDIKQIIKEPTRITEHSKTLIDLVFVNIEHRIVQSRIIYTSLSDHSLVYCVVKGGIPKLPPKRIEYRSFKNYTKDAFVKDLSQVPWSIIGGVESVNDGVFLWERRTRSIRSAPQSANSSGIVWNLLERR